jgi:uncharacterized membrane protein
MLNKAIEQDIKNYLHQLVAELAGQDAALIQDAKYDAESHFRAALEEADTKTNPMPEIIEHYGSPIEIAQYYREMELTVNWALHGRKKPKSLNKSHPVFSILIDMSAYKALVYFLLSLPLAIAYMAWTVMLGFSSAAASIVLVGIPVFILFINSMHFFSLFEGRLIETFLGERMPRRPIYPQKKPTLLSLGAIKALFQNRRNWTSSLYLMLQLPLTILYLVVIVTPALLAAILFLSPIVDPIVHAINPSLDIDINWYWYPITAPLSVLCLLLSLHCAKFIGKRQARYAKAMLVST